MCWSNCILDKVIIYLEVQAVQANQVHQYLPSSLELQEAHIPLAQDSRLVLVGLQALADLGNQRLLPCQGRDTRGWMKKLAPAITEITNQHHLKTVKRQNVKPDDEEWHVKSFTPNFPLGLDCLCDLVTQESLESHLRQACQAVLGLLSLPLSQLYCSNMILLFVQGGPEILLHH